MKTEVDTTLNKLHKPGGLISALQNIQAKYGYLPEEELKKLAMGNGYSLVDIFGAATFYKAFSLERRGKHLMSVCKGTACHVRGSLAIEQKFEEELNIKAGKTTKDKEFTLETVNCLGACAIGPVVVVDGHYFPNVKSSNVPDIIENTNKGLDVVSIETDQRVFPVDLSCPRCNHSLMDPTHKIDKYPAIRVTVSFENNHGWFLMSCLYGSYKVISEHEIPIDTLLNFFCPHCHAELISGAKCGECGAPMVPMIIRKGGVAQICSRSGCKGHILDLEGSTIE